MPPFEFRRSLILDNALLSISAIRVHRPLRIQIEPIATIIRWTQLAVYPPSTDLSIPLSKKNEPLFMAGLQGFARGNFLAHLHILCHIPSSHFVIVMTDQQRRV